MKKKLNLIALSFILSLSVVGGLSTSATALGFSDLLEAGKGHLKDLGDRWNHENEYIGGEVYSTGEFRKDDIGRDSIHWANGMASTIESGGEEYIQLHTDFNTGPAPDLYIYVASEKVVDESTFWAASPVEVSKLKSGSGAQFYKLPNEFELDDHIEVIIWCKRFGAFIGAVTL